MIFQVFSSGPFSATLGPIGGHRYPKGRFGEVLMTTFWGQGQHASIDVSCRRELHSEGSGGSRNGEISRCFSGGVKSAALVGTFGDFSDFGAPLGVPNGSNFG